MLSPENYKRIADYFKAESETSGFVLDPACCGEATFAFCVTSMRGNNGAAQNVAMYRPCRPQASARRRRFRCFPTFPTVSRPQSMNKSRVLQMGTCSRAQEPGPPKIQVRKDFRMKNPAAPFPLSSNCSSIPLLTGCLPGKLVLQGSDAAS